MTFNKTRSIAPPTPIRPSILALPVMNSKGFDIYRYGPVVITVIKETISLDGIELSIQLSNTIIREHGHVASLMIFGPSFAIPSAEVRQRADEATKNEQKEFVCTSNLVLATGMTGSFITMALLGLHALSPKKHKTKKTVHEIEPAAAWITEHLGLGVDFKRELCLAAQPIIREVLQSR